MSNTTFVRRGNVVEMKTDTPKNELTDFNVLMELYQLEGTIAQNKQSIAQAEQQVAKLKHDNELLLDLLKKLRKHEDWAKELQESKARAYIDENKQRFIDEINSSYEYDEALTQEGNKIQKFKMLQDRLGKNRELQGKLAPQILSSFIYKGGYLTNPWKD